MLFSFAGQCISDDTFPMKYAQNERHLEMMNNEIFQKLTSQNLYRHLSLGKKLAVTQCEIELIRTTFS